jgi:cellulose synthase/poly-beta-1,6-N-acetylglucosamine synthase-like glycosyltransferase
MRGVVLLVFWGAALLIVYAYVGYPVWLVLSAWFRPAPHVRKEPLTPRVTLVIVAHNEERVIEDKLRNCLSLDYPKDCIEILVASDGSSDRTEEIAARFTAEGVRVISLEGPRGKPSSLNQAVARSGTGVLVFCDARQMLDPGAVRQLVANFADPGVGAVSGELHIDTGSGSAAGEGVGAYWRYEKLIRRLQSRIGSTVGVTGALYALRRELYRELDPRIILDDVAIPLDVVATGHRVVFEPGARAYDVAPATPWHEYERKVRTLAGNYQLLALRPWLLDPRRNRLFFHFISHKLSRLAVPWCLLVLAGCSAVLARTHGAFYATVLALQVGFYLMALTGCVLDRLRVRSTLFSFPYAFTLLNLAAASSFFAFVLGRQRVAWKGPR